MVVMVKAMKNPRSALCKTSIMACSDIFKAFAEKLTLLKTMDDLVTFFLISSDLVKS